jgi:hypothetical protein
LASATPGRSAPCILERVLLPVRDLVRRWRGPRSRTIEVDAVRRRVSAAVDAGGPSEAVSLARELRVLRPLVTEAFAHVRACSTCARGHTEPHGHWRGGFCCGGATDGVFSPDEVSALALGGTRPGELRPPSGDHAGCAFRGPEGCSLEPVDRPNVCVRFACRELETELRDDGEWQRVRELTKRLETTFARFVKAVDAP